MHNQALSQDCFSTQSHLKLVKQTLGLEQEHNLVHSRPDVLLAQVDDQVGLPVGRSLVWVVDAGEALDEALASLLVDAALVGLLGVLERGGDVDQVEATVLLHELTSGLARLLEWCDRSSNDGSTGL